MEEDKPSQTAIGPAILRAAHQILDQEPRILDDPIAVGLVDGSDREQILEQATALNRRQMKLARSLFVMRSRYAEDCLKEAAETGVRQFVILGAGLDTFAYRQPEWATTFKIFEVDHPSTQGWKRERLKAGSVRIPLNLVFAPCDFEKTELSEALSAASFASNQPAFVSWLGVTQYLTRVAIEATLRFVASLPRGSAIVFQFALPESMLDGRDLEQSQLFTKRAAEVGEPWITRLPPEEWKGWLSRLGYSRIFHLNREIAQARYFSGRGDGLGAVQMHHMMLAEV